jgi:hypothetical protein
LNPEVAAWCEFVGAWHEAHGEKYVPARQLLPFALENAEIAAMLGDREGNYLRRLGKLLSERRDKVFGTWKIMPGPSIREGATYKVASVAGVAGGFVPVRE